MRFSFGFPRLLSKRTFFSGILLVVLLGGLGGGVYLTQNGTNFLPRASERVEDLKTEMVLSTPKTAVSLGEIFPVDIIVHTDRDEANLFVAKLRYPASLKVIKVSTSSAQANLESGDYFIQKWIKINVNNSGGETEVVGGVPNPGIKTGAKNGKDLILARVYFQAESSDPASISAANSEIYRNSDNVNILTTAKSLDLKIDGNRDPNAPTNIDNNPEETLQPLLAPQGGETLAFDSPFRIVWDRELKDVTVSLLVNNQLLGNLAYRLPNASFYNFIPSQKIPVAYLDRNNTFQIKVTGVMDNGQKVSYQNDEPFSIAFNPQVGSNQSALDLLRKLQSGVNIDNTMLSLLLTSFNSDKNVDKVDLNQDGYVNEIDLWLAKNLIKN